MENNILRLLGYFNMTYKVEDDRVIVHHSSSNETQNLSREKLIYVLEHSNATNQLEMRTNLAVVELWEKGNVEVTLNDAGEVMVKANEISQPKKKKRGFFGRRK